MLLPYNYEISFRIFKPRNGELMDIAAVIGGDDRYASHSEVGEQAAQAVMGMDDVRPDGLYLLPQPRYGTQIAG